MLQLASTLQMVNIILKPVQNLIVNNNLMLFFTALRFSLILQIVESTIFKQKYTCLLKGLPAVTGTSYGDHHQIAKSCIRNGFLL